MNCRTLGALVGTGILVAVPAAAIADRVFQAHGHGPDAVHDPAYAGAKVQVNSFSKSGRTTVRLIVGGLPADRTFGAHVHTGHCGSDPLASGGHYQHSSDSAVPLAQREVWLDITTNGHGHGRSKTTVPWSFPPAAAGSVVIHANSTDPTTGSAGARLLCTDVPFGKSPTGGRPPKNP